MSLTQWLTRSSPIVSCRFISTATLIFVPTPSMLATSTGSFMLGKAALKKPAEAADFAQHLGPMRGLHDRAEARLDLVSKVNVDSGAGVGFQAVTHVL